MGTDEEHERDEEFRAAIEYLGGEDLAAKALQRRFPHQQLPEYALVKFLAYQLNRATNGSLNDYFHFIRRHDRFDLMECYWMERTKHYLDDEPRPK